MTAPDASAALTVAELRAGLDEELGRLPKRYRDPLVLCYLQGRTQDEAARQLGWSKGTLRRRLDKGRELLRLRLVRRGLSLSAALFAAALAEGSASSAVAPALVLAAVRAALAHAVGVAGAVSARVLALAQAGAEAGRSKLKSALLLALAVGLLCTGTQLLYRSALSDPPEPAPAVPVAADRLGDPVAAAPANDPAPPRGVEVLTRGPVHEAFAAPSDEALPTPPVPKAPPGPIQEMPPEEKPEGDFFWIGGYWAWDQERTSYLWVSGVWRAPPPGKHWVAGYWREDAEKWQWVPGFWAQAQQNAEKHDVTYLPAPPDAPEPTDPGAPPIVDAFYTPGEYLWQGDAYAWRAGWWGRVQPGYVWVPGHFRWTPYGYVHINGYWDLSLARRGVLYAPAVIDPEVAGPDYVYTPIHVVHHTVVLDAFFVRPRCCHYYYGDYYGPAYHDGGYEPVVVYGRRHHDSLIVSERWDHRDDPRWESAQIDLCVARAQGRAPCPPRTLGEYNRYGHERGLVVAGGPRVAATHGTRMVRMEAAERARAQEYAQAVRQAADERRVAEAKMSVGAPPKPRTASLVVPRAAPLPADGPKPPDEKTPQLANREAVAKALPSDVKLETKFKDLRAGFQLTRVERKLVEMKATVGKDGELRDGGGKLIFFHRSVGYWHDRPTRERVDKECRELAALAGRGTVIEMASPISPR